MEHPRRADVPQILDWCGNDLLELCVPTQQCYSELLPELRQEGGGVMEWKLTAICALQLCQILMLLCICVKIGA